MAKANQQKFLFGDSHTDQSSEKSGSAKEDSATPFIATDSPLKEEASPLNDPPAIDAPDPVSVPSEPFTLAELADKEDRR